MLQSQKTKKRPERPMLQSQKTKMKKKPERPMLQSLKTMMQQILMDTECVLRKMATMANDEDVKWNDE